MRQRSARWRTVPGSFNARLRNSTEYDLWSPSLYFVKNLASRQKTWQKTWLQSQRFCKKFVSTFLQLAVENHNTQLHVSILQKDQKFKQSFRPYLREPRESEVDFHCL
jgi:hypothetical protein